MNDLTPLDADDLSPDLDLDCGISTRGYQMTPVVGLGGSAGAIDALKTFFSSMPSDSGLAFVVVLHLAADHESIVAELLERVTAMPVRQVQTTIEVKPDTVYVIPPGKALSAINGFLELSEPEARPGRHVTVDMFFRTLADTHGPHAAAIVLSGGDGDGAIGIKRIRERGGLTIAQDPLEADHPGMPESAIATGMVDWVLPMAQMAERLLDYFRIGQSLRLPPEEHATEVSRAPQVNADEAALRDVLNFLRSRTGRDFSYYKRATILRRIGRRMQVNGVEGLTEYLNCLRTRSGEAGALLRDLLISVTNFFRDAECFSALEAHIPELFRGKGADDTVRIWVTACATGEEAYSIGMLLSEHARTLAAPPTIQIFATDLNNNAVQIARDGLYPLIIRADVSEDRLTRFFVREHHGYRVRRELREMVLFAMHDLLRDSPFSRLDMVSCRNLLIYLDRPAQTRVFEILHFALRPQGKLFLASSETIDEGNPYFSVVDKKHRIYSQRSAPRSTVPVPTGPSTLGWAMEASRTAQRTPVISTLAFEPSSLPQFRDRLPMRNRDALWGELHLRLLEELAPPSVLVDVEHDIVHLSSRAGRYLQYGAGEPSRNLLRLVPIGLRIELRAALYQAAQTGQSIETAAMPISVDGEGFSVVLRVVPMRENGVDFNLVVFEATANPPDSATKARARNEAEPVAQQLDRELERMKTHLRNTVEQYEASTEELKSSNEELQSINEELRSATEELETSREELQSINEELTTVNLELKSKVDELAHANSDMQNLMDATAIATIFLDRDLRITRYTPSAVRLFNFIPSDIGRPLSDLTPQLQYGELSNDAAQVLEQLVPIEREVGRDDGSWFLARLLPYRTIEDRIAGVVLSFINITLRKQAEGISQWLSSVVASSIDSIVSFSRAGVILSWNPAAQRLYGYRPEEAVGQPVEFLESSSQTDKQAQLLMHVLAGQSIEKLETQRRTKDGRDIQVSLTVSPIFDAQGLVIGGTATTRDIGEARRAADALRRSEEQLRLVIENARDYAIFSTDPELTITTWNPGAEKLLGYTKAEAIGQRCDMIFTPADREAGAPKLEAKRASTDERAAGERFHVRKDGSRFWGSGTLMRMHDNSGGAIGFVKILRDQSPERDAQAALEHSQADLLLALQKNQLARTELEAADRAKDRFLAILSHELRNPLASVSSAAAVMAGDQTAPADCLLAANIVIRQSRTMKILLDDLLDVSRLAAGRLELRFQNVAISTVVEAALETMRPLIRASQHELAIALPDAPVYVNADPLRLTQVIVNLLSNAAKYTRPGGKLSLTVQANNTEMTLSVADNGIGIAVGAFDRIFGFYAQEPAGSFDLNEGLGVGLALIRNIVELHGGTVEAYSDGLEKGSSFHVRLPLGTSPPDAADDLAPGNALPIAPQKILVADDNEDAAWALTKLLQAAGHHTLLASSGEAAVSAAASERPNIAILDIGMPDLDGIEVAQRIRATTWGGKMLLIALTGWGGETIHHRVLDHGFDVHLTKPVDMRLLTQVLAQGVADQQMKFDTNS